MATRIASSADVSEAAVIGDGSAVWHLAQVRERAVLGRGCIVGRGAYIGEGVRMGRHCKVQNYALVYEPAVLADGVFIGPAATLTNDRFPRAVNPDGSLKSASDWRPVGVAIDEGASIGARAVCVAPVRIGAWATVAAGASPSGARKWWMGDIARHAKEADVELREAPVTPSDIAELDGLVRDGKLTDKLARQVLEGVLAGEGTPSEVVSARGLEVVSDDGALVAAVDEALAANPEVAEKIRGGKVQAAGAIVGAVMKATGGKANAARVREIVMERCQ